jgi:hypothetical protein
MTITATAGFDGEFGDYDLLTVKNYKEQRLKTGKCNENRF